MQLSKKKSVWSEQYSIGHISMRRTISIRIGHAMATLIHCGAKKHCLQPKNMLEVPDLKNCRKTTKMGNIYELVEEVGGKKYPLR
jgi:translation initiation factor 2 gamma subunit (eIF-2gamma)